METEKKTDSTGGSGRGKLSKKEGTSAGEGGGSKNVGEEGQDKRRSERPNAGRKARGTSFSRSKRKCFQKKREKMLTPSQGEEGRRGLAGESAFAKKRENSASKAFRKKESREVKNEHGHQKFWSDGFLKSF